jgi:hypothetical protein
MAKIIDTKVPNLEKILSSGYYRLTGNVEMAELIIMIHATSIRNGNELVDVICDYYIGNLQLFEDKKFENITQFIQFVEGNKQGFIVNNLKIKINDNYTQIDLVILEDNVLNLIEIKDGGNFDTKKSKGEFDTLIRSTEFFTNDYKVKSYFCCFNSDGKHQIKDKRLYDFFITGKEICENYKFDFEECVEHRKLDCLVNEKNIVDKMRKIVKDYDDKNK